MSEFFDKLKQKPMSYADLQSAYKDLKSKDSIGTISSGDKQDLGLITSIFGKTTPKSNGGNEASSIFSDSMKEESGSSTLDQKMFDGVSKKDGSLSYDEMVNLKDVNYKVYKNSGDEYPFTYEGEKQSLSKADARHTRVLITGSSDMPEGSEFKPYYFDDKKQPLNDAQLKQNSQKELSKTLDYFKTNDYVFKDANGKDVNMKNVVNNLEKDGYKFEIADDSQLSGANGVINTEDKTIKFNQNAFNLTSGENKDTKTGLNKGFEKTFIHETMHYNDLKTNSNGNLADHTSKFVYNREAYAEGSAINAVEQSNGNPNATQSSTYQEYEPKFLGSYRGNAYNSLTTFQFNSMSKFLNADDKEKKSLFEEIKNASDKIKRVEDAQKNIKPYNYDNLEL